MNDEAHVTDSGPHHLFDDHGEDRFLLTIPIDEGLQGKIPLSLAGCSDDRLGDFHIPFSQCE